MPLLPFYNACYHSILMLFRGVGINCRKGGLSFKGVKHLVSCAKRQKSFGAERQKIGSVTGSHTSCLMTAAVIQCACARE